MARHQGPVFVDTNAILESHRTGAWPALAHGYGIETVAECVAETQAGFQQRERKQWIEVDPRRLRNDCAAIHTVTEQEFSKLDVRAAGILLDIGERALWAHMLGREDNWLLCGPDTSSLQCSVRLGLHERMVSLERLLTDAGHRPRRPLHDNYTKRWLRTTLSELIELERELSGLNHTL